MNPPLMIFIFFLTFSYHYRHEFIQILPETLLFFSLFTIATIIYPIKTLFAIFTAPLRNLSVLWTILPMIVAWIILEIYFNRHEDENIGWNTAICNGMMLFWAGLNILVALSISYLLQKLLVMIILMGYGTFLAYIAFNHKYSAKFTFKLASTNIVYYFGILGILYAHNLIKPTKESITTSLILLGLILLIIRIIKNINHIRKNNTSQNTNTKS